MEGVQILNYVLLLLGSAALGFWLGFGARRTTAIRRERQEEQELAQLRRALNEHEEPSA